MLPRQIQFEGAHNFRDLGGYPLACGGRFEQGLIYRSDHLGALTDRDRQQLRDLGIKTVVDFRRASERVDHPDRLQGTGIDEVWLPVEAEGVDVINIRQAVESGAVDAQGARDYLTRANGAFVTQFAGVFSDFMHLLLEADRYPLVFHCSAGKDRAGFAAALTLLVAGVSRDTIMADYLATNDCNARYRAALMATVPDSQGGGDRRQALDVLMQVEPAYLGSAFAAIEAGYRDDKHFLAEALNFDSGKCEALRGRLGGLPGPEE